MVVDQSSRNENLLGKVLVGRMAGFLLTGALLAVGSGCSSPASEAGVSDEVVSQACQVIVEELKTTGTSLADLVPADPSTVDAAVLAEAYNVSGAALDRAAGRAGDVEVRQILSVAGASMAELSPVFEAVAAGDQTALAQVKEPLKELGGIVTQCSTVVVG